MASSFDIPVGENSQDYMNQAVIRKIIIIIIITVVENKSEYNLHNKYKQVQCVVTEQAVQSTTSHTF